MILFVDRERPVGGSDGFNDNLTPVPPVVISRQVQFAPTTQILTNGVSQVQTPANSVSYFSLGFILVLLNSIIKFFHFILIDMGKLKVNFHHSDVILYKLEN